MRGFLSLLLALELTGCSGCHGSGLAGDTSTDETHSDLVDPIEELDDVGIPDFDDPETADTFDVLDVPDVFDPPWDPDVSEPFPDPDPIDPWVPDYWDVPFDYMDIPPDYEPDPEYCGNGTVDPGEECDDGNTNNNDECTNSCLFPRCGDGIVWHAWEDCDPPGVVRPCTTSCGTTGGEWCEVFCRWTGVCVPPLETCGNAVDDDCDTVVDSIVRLTDNLMISHMPVDQQNARIAWTGSEFAVLWMRCPEIPVLSRLDTLGRKTGWDTDMPLAANYFYDLHWTGTLLGYFAASEVTHSEYNIFRQAIHTSGVPLASGGGIVADAWWTLPSAWTGSEYGVVTSGYDSYSGTWHCTLGRLPADGTGPAVESTLRTYSGLETKSHELVWTGSAFIHVFQQQITSGYAGSAFYMDTIASDGSLISTVDLELPVETSSDQTSFDMVWTGSTLALAWVAGSHLWTSINTLDGALLSGYEISARSRNYRVLPEIVWTGSELGLLWIDNRTGNYDIYYAAASADGSPRTPVARLTRTPEEDYEYNLPSAVWTGSSYGVAWRDWNGLDVDIYFTHFAPCP